MRRNIVLYVVDMKATSLFCIEFVLGAVFRKNKSKNNGKRTFFVLEIKLNKKKLYWDNPYTNSTLTPKPLRYNYKTRSKYINSSSSLNSRNWEKHLNNLFKKNNAQAQIGKSLF